VVPALESCGQADRVAVIAVPPKNKKDRRVSMTLLSILVRAV
jgi:hypothetical protein